MIRSVSRDSVASIASNMCKVHNPPHKANSVRNRLIQRKYPKNCEHVEILLDKGQWI